MDISDKLETHNDKTDNLNDTEGALRVQEIYFVDSETKVVVNAKFFLDLNKNIEYIKINLKYLEPDYKNNLLEKKNDNILDASKLIEEQQNILRNHFERNLISELEKCKSEAVNDTIQSSFDKGLFDLFGNKDQTFEPYLMFTDEYLLEKKRNRNTNIRWFVLFIRLRLFNERRYREVLKKMNTKTSLTLNKE